MVRVHRRDLGRRGEVTNCCLLTSACLGMPARESLGEQKSGSMRRKASIMAGGSQKPGIQA